VNGRLKPVLTLLLFVACSARAGELQRAATDVKSLITAPLHWRAREWRRFGEGAALVVAVGAADKQIEDAVQRNRSSTTNSFSKAITPWGGHRALEVSALLIGAGYLSHNPNVLGAGRDSLEAELWAAGVVTPLIKYTLGRARPNADLGTYRFHPLSSHDSFPSGHATNAFAAATAIADHYDNWIVPTIVYTVATSVALSRVNDRVHWPSDIVAGAAIGWFTGRYVFKTHLDHAIHKRPASRLNQLRPDSVLPMWDPTTATRGIALTWRHAP